MPWRLTVDEQAAMMDAAEAVIAPWRCTATTKVKLLNEATRVYEDVPVRVPSIDPATPPAIFKLATVVDDIVDRGAVASSPPDGR